MKLIINDSLLHSFKLFYYYCSLIVLVDTFLITRRITPAANTITAPITYITALFLISAFCSGAATSHLTPNTINNITAAA